MKVVSFPKPLVRDTVVRRVSKTEMETRSHGKVFCPFAGKLFGVDMQQTPLLPVLLGETISEGAPHKHKDRKSVV